MTVYERQLVDYKSALTAVLDTYGGKLGETCGHNAQRIVLWMHWYRTHLARGHAAELLLGIEASIREAAGCVAVGLGRAALTAIRTQIDLLLGYTYFREHPAEWRCVCDTGEGFKLKADILKYHAEYTPGFSLRRGLLEQVGAATLNGVYATLSAHVHGQSKYSVPQATKLNDLIWTEARLSEVVAIQEDAAQGLSFFLLAVHGHEWRDLPSVVVAEGRNFLKPAQEALFFA